MKRIIALSLVICAVAMTARAQSVSSQSGTSLYRYCGLGAVDPGYWLCVGYIKGFRDGVSLGHDSSAKEICIPPEVTTRQIIEVVQQALRKSQTRHEQAWTIISPAMVDAWPCPK